MKDCSSVTLPAQAKSLCLLLLCLLPATLLAGPAPAPTQRQLQLFSSNCVQCHARPGIGAPLMGNAEDWKSRQAQGEEVLLVNVVEGIRGMPPLGYCSACNQEDFRVLIRLLLPATEQQP
jgi:cytochrome c5